MSFLNVNQVNTAGNLPSFTTGANTINFNGSVIGGSSASTMKNRIINGAMVINQYNANSSVAIASDGQYFIDRYQGKTTQASKYNAQMMTPFTSGYVTPPAGFTNYLALTVASAYSVVSTDYFYINQRIEGYNITDWAWGTANAKPITISFWVYSNVTGTFGGCLQNIDASYTYPFTYNISNPNTWQYITVTITPPTAGGWNNNNGIGLVVCISLGVGSNYSATPFVWGSGLSSRSATGAVSIMGSTSNYLYLTGLQVEVGSTATTFDFRHYQQELALCQRYFQYYSYSTAYTGTFPTTGNNSGVVALGGAANSGRGIRSFKVQMRASPTFLLYGNTGGTSGFLSDISNSTTPAVSYAEGSQDGLTSINFSNTIGVGDVLTGQVSASAEL